MPDCEEPVTVNSLLLEFEIRSDIRVAMSSQFSDLAKNSKKNWFLLSNTIFPECFLTL
jgi:hypothetical protein